MVIVKLFIEFMLFIYRYFQVFHHTVIQLGVSIATYFNWPPQIFGFIHFFWRLYVL